MADGIVMKVVGIGGAGNNVVSRMIANGISGVSYANMNTDKPALLLSGAAEQLQLGVKLTRGQGAGSKPDVGAQAAEEDRAGIERIFKDVDAAFLTAGMGGGTGTGASPVAAAAAKAAGALTIAVVSKPFRWEGSRKMRTAEEGIKTLTERVDTIFVIPNENIRKVSDKKVSFAEAFAVSDEVLNRAVSGIADVLRSTGFINLDFNDLKKILQNSGLAHLGIGEASGSNKVEEVTASVIHSDLTETSVKGARRLIVNVVGSEDLAMDDVAAIMERIQQAAHPDANLIWGMGFDTQLVDAVRVIVIATDFADEDTADETPEAVQAVVDKQRDAAGSRSAEKPGDAEWESWLEQYFGKK